MLFRYVYFQRTRNGTGSTLNVSRSTLVSGDGWNKFPRP